MLIIKRWLTVSIVAFGCLFAPFAIGNQAALQSAYEAILEDPADISRTLEYARVAAVARDYEAAIGALERILLISPEQHKIRATLGMLYHRLESYEIARFHLEKALASGDLPYDLAVRADNVLRDVDRSDKRHAIRGSFSLGFRYRDNANAGPRSAVVLSRGFSVALSDEFQEDGDGDFFVVGNAVHTYDLGPQNGTLIETDGAFYGNRQFGISDINNISAEIRSGFRFGEKPAGEREFSVRPHLVVNVISRGDDLFSNVYGGGFDFRYLSGGRFLAGGTFQHRQREYHESNDRPRLDERDGHENFGSVFARYLFGSRVSVLGRFNVIDRHAKVRFQESVEVGALGRADVGYSAPFKLGSGGNWRAYASVIYRNLDFDVPNPRTDPTKVRNDDEWRIMFGNAMPITRYWRANLEISYSEVGSNIANFERNNFSVAVSATRRF